MKHLIYLLAILLLSSCKIQNMYVKDWCKKNDVIYPLSKDKTISHKNKMEVRNWAFKSAQLYWDSVYKRQSDSLYVEWKKNNTCESCDYNYYPYYYGGGSLRPYYYYRSYQIR